MLLRDRAGASTVEFAFVAPIFLMALFLILDGGRMMFTRAALNELASATARCAALKVSGCSTASAAASWATSRGRTRSRLSLTSSMVTVAPSTTCNGVSSMAKATIAMPYKRGAMGLLPQSLAPSTLTAESCFPVA